MTQLTVTIFCSFLVVCTA